MFLTDDPTAVASLPTPGAAGTPGYFTDGNPGSGVPATILRAEFMNMIMMELQNIILAAGVTPSKTTFNQVLQALPAALASRPEMAGSLGSSGYQKLPGGLIIQWGTIAANASGSTTTVTLPISYSNSNYRVALQFTDALNDDSRVIQLQSKSNGSFVMQAFGSAATTADFISIGY